MATPVKAAPVKKAAPNPEAAALVDAGAEPTVVDVESLLRQLRAVQKQVDQLTAAQATAPTDDPVAAGVVNLTNHVKAQCNTSTVIADNAGDVWDALKTVSDKNADDVTSEDTAYLREVVEEFGRSLPHYDVSYVVQLARDLHRETLKRERE